MSSTGAIASAPVPGIMGAGQSPAGIEAQLAQYQIQLADWVSCPSCNTPEGKAKIQELTNKVSDARRRIEAAETRPTGKPSAALSSGVTTTVNGAIAVPSLSSVNYGDVSSPHTAFRIGTIGALVNVFA